MMLSHFSYGTTIDSILAEGLFRSFVQFFYLPCVFEVLLDMNPREHSILL